MSIFTDDMLVQVENPREHRIQSERGRMWIQQGHRIQNQHTKMNHIRIYSQWTCENRKMEKQGHV